MSNFDDFIEALKEGLEDFAEDRWKDFKDAALNDGKSFLDASKEDLERWTKSLANGNLNKNDFEWLLESKKDLAELFALKQIGLTKVALDRFLNGFIDLIISTAFKTFLQSNFELYNLNRGDMKYFIYLVVYILITSLSTQDSLSADSKVALNPEQPFMLENKRN